MISLAPTAPEVATPPIQWSCQLASIEAFAPFILLELVVAVVSILILIALVVKASLRDVQNNTNVYLFSLGIAGLLQSFNLLTLLLTVLARKWVLGGGRPKTSEHQATSWDAPNTTQVQHICSQEEQ